MVTGRAHREAVLDQLDVPAEAVLAEPSARDSMAAIGLAAALLERRDPDAVMGSFAADHVITEPAVFHAAVATAVEAARAGLAGRRSASSRRTPPPASATSAPATRSPGCPGRGWCASSSRSRTPRWRRRTSRSGYRWNAGMFIVRPTVLLDLLAEGDPGFAAALRAIAADPATLEEAWESLPRIAVDHAVAEPAAAAGRVAVVPGRFGWDDVGDFASLRSLLPAADGELVVLGDRDRVRAIDSTGLVVPAGDRVVAVVGLEDVVVVDTGDALLVTTRARAQDVKSIVAALKEDGHVGLT